MNDEKASIWKACHGSDFKAPPLHFRGNTEEYHDTSTKSAEDRFSLGELGYWDKIFISKIC